MPAVLALAEVRRGELRDVSLELVTAGRELAARMGGGLAVGIVAADPERHVEELGGDGVDEVLTVRTPTEHFEPHVQQRALEALIEEQRPSLVLVGFTVDSLGFAPAAAAKLGLGFASDVTRLALDEDRPVARRGFYGGKVEVELEFGDRECVLAMLRAGAWEPADARGGVATRSVDVAFDDPPTEHVEFVEVETGDVDITAADFLVSIGRGVEDQDGIEQFERLAERMGATLSVSRPLVDAGWMPNARQVGQSGKTVAPKLYLALGISGAVQHLAGMQTSETIIAVNTDPEAPIFGVAHYGAVADMFDVAEELAEHFE